jgi:hypothetical protein
VEGILIKKKKEQQIQLNLQKKNKKFEWKIIYKFEQKIRKNKTT